MRMAKHERSYVVCRNLLASAVMLFSSGAIDRRCVAQSPTRYKLAPATARVAGNFKDAAIREIANGRVVYVNGGINVLDMGTGQSKPIGRKGKGPLEYPGRVTHLYPLGGDSTVIGGQGKWLFMKGDSIVGELTGVNDALVLRPLYGFDGNGHCAMQALDQKVQDLYLTRVTRTNGRADTLDRMGQSPEVATTIRGHTAGGLAFPHAYDFAVTFLDGWIAVARYQPYRIDWWSPNGGWIRGAPISYASVKLDATEKGYYMEDLARRTATKLRNADDYMPVWRQTYPPFDLGNARPTGTADGRVILRHFPSSSRREYVYDIVNRRGQLDGQLVLPLNERIVGFGAKTVYILEETEDGETWLRRHPWPPAPGK
jgi:hypothetical protein